MNVNIVNQPLRLTASSVGGKMFPRCLCSSVPKFKSIAVSRAYSVCTINPCSDLKLNHLYQGNKCRSYLFTVETSKFAQRRSFSSQLAPDNVSHPPIIWKFLTESSPVLFAQENLVFLHDLTCLPWWATIISTTIVLRTAVTLPLAVYQNRVLARYENILQEMPAIVKELKMETAYAVKKFNWTEKQARIVYNRSLQKQLKKLIIRDNCHPAKATLLLWVQIPMWICLSASLRNLVYMLPQHSVGAEINFVQLTKEGLLWFTDLTVPDSTFLLPLIFGLTNLAIIEIMALSKVKAPGKLQKFLTNFFRIFTVGMTALATQVPSCLTVYWVTSSVYGLVQNLILMSPRVKKFFRIPEAPSQLKHPYMHIYTRLRERVDKLFAFQIFVSKEK